MYIKFGNDIINSAAISDIDYAGGGTANCKLAMLSGNEIILRASDVDALLDIFSLQNNLLDMAEVAKYRDGLAKLIEYRNKSQGTSHQLTKMMMDSDKTIEDLEALNRLETQLKSKVEQQSFDFDSIKGSSVN